MFSIFDFVNINLKTLITKCKLRLHCSAHFIIKFLKTVPISATMRSVILFLALVMALAVTVADDEHCKFDEPVLIVEAISLTIFFNSLFRL